MLPRTLDELASLAGVSRATVSRVINGGSVSTETKERVQAVLEEANYRPNAAARALARGRSGVVGVALHVTPALLFLDPYFSQLLHGLSEALPEQTTGMMLWLQNRSQEEILDRILSIGVLDGVIVTANYVSDALVDGLLASNIPTVLIGHRKGERRASYVDIDNIAAADMVTSHLVGLGRTRIGHIKGTRGTVAGEDRLVGYRRAMERAALSTEGLVVDGSFDRASGVAGAQTLIDQGVDAIFCGNDATALGALDTIRARGKRVPDDIALAGFDDLDFAAHMDPPLTTVHQGVPEIGAEAVRILIQLLQDPAGGPRRVILPTELIVRRSTYQVSRDASERGKRISNVVRR